MQVKKQQLEPDMEQWTGSKLGKEYNKAVYIVTLLILPSVQSRSREIPSSIKHKLESGLLGEITTSYMQVIPPKWKKAQRN